MKRLLTILAVVALTAMAGNAQAAIGWAGNVYPNDGYAVTPTGDQFVVAQVWKDGVTTGAGQGPDISAVLRYQTDLMGAPADLPMSYNTDIGNNDEYIGFIPQGDIVGASTISVTVIFTDTSDATDFEVTGDQNGNPPPLTYTVSDVLPNDVNVTFTLCMSGAPTAGAACVVGNRDELTNWGAGVPMTNVGGELWEIVITFPAGTSPNFEYKYKRDDCADWEPGGNRVVALPTDGTTDMALAPDSWNNLPIGCGFGDMLTEDKEVCFQVCMDGVEYTGNVCVTGGGAALTDWGDGLVMQNLGGGLFQACVTYPQGTNVPLTQEFKFKKDDCATWESAPNRSVVIEDASPAFQTVTYTFDDGPGMCAPIGTEEGSWGSLKSRY